jgi:hypothetical protein
VSVRVGSTRKDSGGTVYNIVDVIRHPNFHPIKLEYDFAILRTDKPIICDDKRVKRIPLPKPDEELPDDTECSVAGWGN